MIPRTVALLALPAIVACASSSTTQSETVTRVGISSTIGNMGRATIHNDAGETVRSLEVPADSVWRGLPRVYEMLGIPDVGAMPGQRVLGARNFRPRRIEDKRLSTYIDCGYGPTATPKADEYEVTMTLTSAVTAESDAVTTVQTILEASAQPRASSGQRISCQSTGVLEKRIGDLLVGMLVSGR